MRNIVARSAVIGTMMGLLAAVAGAGAGRAQLGGPANAAEGTACADPRTAPALGRPAEPACANHVLTAYDRLLVLAPHPDDETLGFAGLLSAYREQGKPVEVVVVTDGDGYCEACRLWKSSSTRGPMCDALELSNLTTPAIDSLAEVRRSESAAAAALLALPPPAFLGYPDTGLKAAWSNFGAGALDQPLRRSDFSLCRDCETCEGGWGGGPATELSAATLVETLRRRLAVTSENTLVATTHWLDGHGDHAGLGHFVRTLNRELPRPRAVAYAVIHANTKKETPHSDCWYPAPQALACPCAEPSCAAADPRWVAALSKHRFRPDWPAALPDDAEYGEERQLCLAESLYRGDGAKKLLAVRVYASQLGTLARSGRHPDGIAGILDCNGYLTSFVRRTEAFALEVPAAAGQSYVPFAAYSAEEDARILAAFAGLRVADVSDGMDAVGLPDVGLVDPEITALWRDTERFTHRVTGIAVTARYVPTHRRSGPADAVEFPEWEGDWYERLSPEPFVELLRPGSMIVIDAEDDGDTGSIGSYNILEWKLRGAVGVVTSGGARDTDEVIKQRVPLYLRRLGRGIRPGRNEIESVNRPVVVGGVLVRPGDVVVADGDGVIVVPRQHAPAVAAIARQVHEGDKEGRRELYRKLGLPEDPSVVPRSPPLR